MSSPCSLDPLHAKDLKPPPPDSPFRSSTKFNWSLSLVVILSLIVFVIPLGLCLLLTHRSTNSGSTPFVRTLLLTLVPFAVYLFVFERVGSIVASKIVVEGTHSLGR